MEHKSYSVMAKELQAAAEDSVKQEVFSVAMDKYEASLKSLLKDIWVKATTGQDIEEESKAVEFCLQKLKQVQLVHHNTQDESQLVHKEEAKVLPQLDIESGRKKSSRSSMKFIIGGILILILFLLAAIVVVLLYSRMI